MSNVERCKATREWLVDVEHKKLVDKTKEVMEFLAGDSLALAERKIADVDEWKRKQILEAVSARNVEEAVAVKVEFTEA